MPQVQYKLTNRIPKLGVHIDRGELVQVSYMHACSPSRITDQLKTKNKLRMVNNNAVQFDEFAPHGAEVHPHPGSGSHNFTKVDMISR